MLFTAFKKGWFGYFLSILDPKGSHPLRNRKGLNGDAGGAAEWRRTGAAQRSRWMRRRWRRGDCVENWELGGNHAGRRIEWEWSLAIL